MMIHDIRILCFLGFAVTYSHAFLVCVGKTNSRPIFLPRDCASKNSAISGMKESPVATSSSEEEDVIVKLRAENRLLWEVQFANTEIIKRLMLDVETLKTEFANVTLASKSKRIDGSIYRHFGSEFKYCLSAQEFGEMAESKAMDAILPHCESSPFSIYSLWSLLEFVKDPIQAEEVGHCSKGAAVSWFRDMSHAEREKITRNSNILLHKYPTIVASLQYLRCTLDELRMNMEEIIEFYGRYDITLANALKEIRPIVKDDWSLESESS